MIYVNGTMRCDN